MCISRKLYSSNYIYILFLRAIKRVVLITLNITFKFVSVETKKLLVPSAPSSCPDPILPQLNGDIPLQAALLDKYKSWGNT